MAKSTFDTKLQKFSENRFFILLVLILATIVLTPFLDQFINHCLNFGAAAGPFHLVDLFL
jgi:hypothetical protein